MRLISLLISPRGAQTAPTSPLLDPMVMHLDQQMSQLRPGLHLQPTFTSPGDEASARFRALQLKAKGQVADRLALNEAAEQAKAASKPRKRIPPTPLMVNYTLRGPST